MCRFPASGSGATMELGRSWRTLLLLMMMLLLRPHGAGELRGHRQQAALKDQRFRAGVYLNGAHFPRARARRSRATRSVSRPTRSSRLGGASPISFSRVLFRDFPSDVGQHSDPQSDRPAGAACWPPSPLLEFGLGAGAAAAAPDSLVWSAAPGERSEVRGRLRYHPDRNSTELGGACSRSRNGRL